MGFQRCRWRPQQPQRIVRGHPRFAGPTLFAPRRGPTGVSGVPRGGVRHSLADISKAQLRLGYAPSHRISEGLVEAMAWYVQDLG